MALPRIDAPEYEIELYNGDIIKYRPFLVKEQKILLLAMEEGEQQSMLNAIKKIIDNCTFGNLDVDNLPLFEIENIFLRLREKSVGESIDFKVKCTEDDCEGLTNLQLNLSDVTYDRSKIQDGAIVINDTITINMKFPTVKTITSVKNVEKVTDNFEFLTNCIDTIEANDNIIDTKTTPKEELKDFIDSMTTEQFGKIRAFLEGMPKISTTLEYSCTMCGKDQTREIRGLQNFLV